QAVSDVHLVENRELNGYSGKRLRHRQLPGNRQLVLVFHVKIHKVVPVPPVDCQDAQYEEIDDEDQDLRQRHKRMIPRLSINGDITVRLEFSSMSGGVLLR